MSMNPSEETITWMVCYHCVKKQWQLRLHCREFMDNEGPLVSEKTKRKAVSAHQVVQEVLSQTGASLHLISSEVWTQCHWSWSLVNLGVGGRRTKMFSFSCVCFGGKLTKLRGCYRLEPLPLKNPGFAITIKSQWHSTTVFSSLFRYFEKTFRIP